jgi:hypothetical protein
MVELLSPISLIGFGAFVFEIAIRNLIKIQEFADYSEWQGNYTPVSQRTSGFYYYNVVLFCKFLTVKSISSRNIAKFLIKHCALT